MPSPAEIAASLSPSMRVALRRAVVERAWFPYGRTEHGTAKALRIRGLLARKLPGDSKHELTNLGRAVAAELEAQNA